MDEHTRADSFTAKHEIASIGAGSRAAQMVCPACARATAHRFLYRRNGCDIFRCETCGLGRTETRDFDPEDYYTSDYFDGGHVDGYADYRGAEPVLRREFAHVADFIRTLKPNGRLLEIGCAYGFFLEAARSHFDVTGIELAADAAAHARGLGHNVVTGVADGATLAKLGTFDVIVLLDVIEHLPAPDETLALCAGHLNPGGVMVITTGDFGSRSARLAGAHWRLMTPPQHLWFFTRDSMRRMGEAAGLRLERFDHPWKIVPLSLIVFQLKRIFGLRPAGTATASTVGVPINLFDAMRVVLRKSPP